MKELLLATGVIVMMGAPALAASMTNKDAEARTVVVTDGGAQIPVSLNAGESISFCPNGCFVTFPNGDREALTGSETIEISGGKAVFK